MDKSFMVFITIGIGFLYFVTTFIGGIQKEDEAYQNNQYKKERQYDMYMTVDSIGQDMLDVTGQDIQTQVAAWNSMQLKNELTTLFPDFSEMKNFIKGRVRGKELQNKLYTLVNRIEDEIISGTMSSEQAKKELDLLK